MPGVQAQLPDSDVASPEKVEDGKGQAYVGEQAFPLDAESMLWLEKDDIFYLEAGTDGLEVLLCHAPGNE